MKRKYPNKPLLKVIKYLGTQVKLARYCKVKPQVVTWWLKNHLPAERVLQVEALTKGLVSRYELRPDIYTPDFEVKHE